MGDCVGELEFIYNHRTVADVRAKTPEVRAAALNRAHFEMCMGPIVDVLKRHAGSDNATYDYYNARKSLAEDEVLEASVSFRFGSGGADDDDDDDDEAAADDGEGDGVLSPKRNVQTASRIYLSAIPSAMEAGPPQLRERRRSVSNPVITDQEIADFQPTVVPKTSAERHALVVALQDSPLFAHTDDRELQLAINAMTKKEFANGEQIITQGDEFEDANFYFICKGTCVMIVDGREVCSIGACSIGH